ncbi:DNA topoisomerase 3 [Gudongella sp. SC589]|uniref:DNA topoisomerase 3 n=1 Tax=Gudongella sp. SC589 TaxID=3385990 RepID=UPI0039047548
MKLVIAEKPSGARSIAEVLKAYNKYDGYLEGNGYMVTWCIGHLVGLADADVYENRYKKWKLEDLPIIPDVWETTIFNNTSKQFSLLNRLLNDKRVKEIICATDAGREGELIFRLVYKKANCNKPVKRLWISSMEDSAIERGFNNLKDGKAYDNLYSSALARAKADWLVGINATRLFTTLYGNLLSVGRVQTPTLSMIVEREHIIQNFKSKSFYHVQLDFGEFIAESQRIEDKNKARELLSRITNNSGVCEELEGKEQVIKAPLPFDLTTLQREANRYFGYTAKQTLDYLQELYEKKLITYPRTDSRYLTEDMEENIKTIIEDISDNTNYTNLNIKKIINNDKVNDHHAIVPTKEIRKFNMKELPLTLQNIFGLIYMRLISSVLDDCLEKKIRASFIVNDEKFVVTGKKVVKEGFKKVENSFISKFKEAKCDKEFSELPNIIKGREYAIKNKNIREGKSTSPKRYTEDTLLGAMEKAGIEDIDKDLDTEKQGLGTPATRATIIEKLISIGYLERKKKQLIPTHKAFSLITVIPDELKSPSLTSDWENMLTEISMGYMEADTFMEGIEDFVKDIISNYSHVIKENPFQTDKEKIGKCPRCGSPIYESKKNFYCNNNECKFAMFKEDRFFISKKKKLNKQMVIELLKEGSTFVTGFYSSKKDKKYDAIVILEDTGKYVNYRLEFK